MPALGTVKGNVQANLPFVELSPPFRLALPSACPKVRAEGAGFVIIVGVVFATIWIVTALEAAAYWVALPE